MYILNNIKEKKSADINITKGTLSHFRHEYGISAVVFSLRYYPSLCCHLSGEQGINSLFALSCFWFTNSCCHLKVIWYM